LLRETKLKSGIYLFFVVCSILKFSSWQEVLGT
jgi:hypothetical protein